MNLNYAIKLCKEEQQRRLEKHAEMIEQGKYKDWTVNELKDYLLYLKMKERSKNQNDKETEKKGKYKIQR